MITQLSWLEHWSYEPEAAGSSPAVITAFLAQLVERKTFNLVVVGSSPTEGKLYIFFFINSLVGRVVKAADLRSVGRQSAWVRTPHQAHEGGDILFYIFIIVRVAQLDSASDF